MSNSLTVSDTPQKHDCDHPYKRVSWQATSQYQPGFGGYYTVGVFDSTVSCRDCGAVLYTEVEAPPLCLGCQAPMSRVGSNGSITTCGDALTDQLLCSIDLEHEEKRYLARFDRYWEWYCAREEKKEAAIREKLPPEEPIIKSGDAIIDMMRRFSRAERHDGRSFRIFRRSTLRQVWPYVCTSFNCSRHGRLKFIHTPGD